MYCVVQIGSRMLRFECGTMRSTFGSLCAWASPASAAAARATSVRRAAGIANLQQGEGGDDSRCAERPQGAAIPLRSPLPLQQAAPTPMARIAVGGFQHETNTFAPS